MRILFFIYDLGIGGAEKNTVKVANYLALKGYDISILTLSDLNLLENKISQKVDIYSLNSKKIFGNVRNIYQFLKHHSFEIVFVNIWPLTFLTAVAGSVLKTKIIPIEHGILSKEFKPKGKFFCWLQNFSIFIAYNFLSHHVITVSKAAKKDLQTKGVFKNKITVIYNSFETFVDNNLVLDHPEWTDYLGPKLITIANLKSEKNLFNLLKAFHTISLKIEPCPKLLIIGSGPQEEELKELSKNLQIDDSIIFAGLKIDPYPYLDKADLFILSSDFEAFGIVILEAMSLGKTIVSTASEGPMEIINRPSLGYLCKVNDSDDLAEKIAKALDQPLDKTHVISRSQEFVIEKIGALYEDFIRAKLAHSITK
jgi:glycosyltransferase involved in cell wall biosynthesis